MAKLAEYRAKRDFEKTPEPAGEAAGPKGSSFVIQKHAASRLHYDVRLELDGVLKSWAVAKGPSLVPGEKRLAVHVEDHPLEYGGFEGTIPKGEYGGGTVLLWDRGTWEPEGDPHKAYAKGHLDFRLDGEKLHGKWHLVRMRPRPRDKKEQWLLIKSADEAARAPDEPDILDEAPLSVKTGRDLDQIAADADATWSSKGAPAPQPKVDEIPAATKRSAKVAKPGRGSTRTVAPEAPPADGETLPPEGGKKAPPAGGNKAVPASGGKALRAGGKAPPAGGKKAPMPNTVEPCLATLVAEVPSGEAWIHEIKWDGYRLIVFVDKGEVRIHTRNGLDWTARFPAIAEAFRLFPVETAIVDGEAVVEDENGISSFSALQDALSSTQDGVASQAIFHAFDLLYSDGFDLRGLPLEDRKSALATLVPPGSTGALRLSEHIDADGPAMIRSACRLGLEGVISKRRDRPYRSGRRDDWVKAKCTERQEFVIAGFTPSTALKNAVGSLVLAYNQDGHLVHAGRTGTGFTADLARDVYKRLGPLRTKEPAFSEKLSALQRRSAVWVEPKLVCEVEFRGWTTDGHVRHAAFKGLRDDKTAAEVVRELPREMAAAPETASASETATAPKKRSKPRTAAAAPANGSVEVAGVALTHPDRILWEGEGITKQGLAEFYDDIAEWILPHVAHRPLSLVRCPSGSQQGCFFQKHAWAGLTDFVHREMVRDEDGEEEVLHLEDIRGLIALVQAGVLEIHPWGSTMADVERPDRIIFDFDPGEGVDWPAIIAGAREVRERLAVLGLESFVKTTGGKGLHVMVPLLPKAGWDEVKAFCKDVAEAMERDSPSRYISKSVKRDRTGKIFVDYLRNSRGQTAVAAFSTRARPGAPVSTPLTWDELSPAIKPNHFTIANLGARLSRLRQDPWAGLFEVRQTLPGAPRRTARPKR